MARAVGRPIPGVNAFSVPVFDQSGSLALVITAIGPEGIFDADWESPIATKLLECRCQSIGTTWISGPIARIRRPDRFFIQAHCRFTLNFIEGGGAIAPEKKGAPSISLRLYMTFFCQSPQSFGTPHVRLQNRKGNRCDAASANPGPPAWRPKHQDGPEWVTDSPSAGRVKVRSPPSC